MTEETVAVTDDELDVLLRMVKAEALTVAKDGDLWRVAFADERGRFKRLDGKIEVYRNGKHDFTVVF